MERRLWRSWDLFLWKMARTWPGRSTMALGRNIDRIQRIFESIEAKFAKIFKRPKNREDGSDFDDFWTESIASMQSIFSKFFERTNYCRSDRIDRSYRSMAALLWKMARTWLTCCDLHGAPLSSLALGAAGSSTFHWASIWLVCLFKGPAVLSLKKIRSVHDW